MKALNYACENLLTIRPSDSIDRAVSLMEEHGVHHLVVVSGNRTVGMLSDRDILISTGWMLAVERKLENQGGVATAGPTRVEQIMSTPVASLPPSASAKEAALLMLDRRINAVPIALDGHILALVTERTLVHWLDDSSFVHTASERLLSQDVRELMRAHLFTVEPGGSIADVVSIFHRHRVRHVPVAVDSVLKGIISDRDVRRALGWASVRDAQSQASGRLDQTHLLADAASIMQTEVQTVRPADSLRSALRRMQEHRIHSLPVVEDNQLVGIITETDFVRAIAHEELL